MSWYGDRFPPYVSVAERKSKAGKEIEKLKKKGKLCHPIIIEGKSITNTFWGNAWCKNLEFYSDYENRLPRGRSYVRNGFVIDLQVATGKITAKVFGSSIYKINITIDKVIPKKWKHIVKECTGKIDSMIELLQGNFSKAVMQIICDPKTGLFPHPKEIKLSCSCPDWAEMCKHVAAVLYGIGARLDKKPEELFLLRQADHFELISKTTKTSLTQSTSDQNDHILENADLSSLFGIDINDSPNVTAKAPVQNKKLKKKKSKSRAPRANVRKPAKKAKKIKNALLKKGMLKK